MADTVSFKVYLTAETDLHGTKTEVRRFGIDKDVVTNFLYLSEKLQSVFASLRGKHFSVFWKDLDGDDVVISSDEELRIALTDTERDSVRKLYVTLHSDQPSYNLPINDEHGTVHVDVMCDGCDKNVKGFRYKCLQCNDYDLCSQCEAKGMHPEHCMLRSAAPLQWRSHFGRRLAHHVNKFAKKNSQYHAKEREAPECPYKRSRCHAQQSGRPERPSWLDNLTTYLNDWSYPVVEGECPMKEPSAPQQEKPSKSKNNGTPHESAHPHTEFFKNIGDSLATLLDPLGIDVSVQLKPDAPAKTPEDEGAMLKRLLDDTRESISGSSTPKFPGPGKKLVEDPRPTERAAPKPVTTVENEIPASSETQSLENDGWMVFGEPAPTHAAAAPPTAPAPAPGPLPSTSSNGAIPKQPAPDTPAVPIATGPIYPILPKEVEPVVYHQSPKIQRAVLAMMQMGFSNEGGWLTQLLASHNGDISKVLDILQPVGPARNALGNLLNRKE